MQFLIETTRGACPSGGASSCCHSAGRAYKQAQDFWIFFSKEKCIAKRESIMWDNGISLTLWREKIYRAAFTARHLFPDLAARRFRRKKEPLWVLLASIREQSCSKGAQQQQQQMIYMRKRVEIAIQIFPIFPPFSEMDLQNLPLRRNSDAHSAYCAQGYRTQSLLAGGGGAAARWETYSPTNSATALKGQVWLVLLLFRKAGFIWKSREKLFHLRSKHTPIAPAVRDTYAAQANPVLVTLRHVLQVILLRAVP